MKLERMMEIETNDIYVDDRIHVGKYTATCQEITPKGALFLLDQYITGHGYLREAMQSEEVLNDFAGIRRYMVQFEDGDMLKIPFGYIWRNSEISRFRPIFLISMRKEDATKKSATKKSATKKSVPENEETIQDVFDTFNEKQRLVLYYIVGKTIENEETILDVLDTFNEKQRLVLNYLVGKAIKDAKKGKTSESDEDESENDNTEHLTSTGFPDCGAGMREGNNE